MFVQECQCVYSLHYVQRVYTRTLYVSPSIGELVVSQPSQQAGRRDERKAHDCHVSEMKKSERFIFNELDFEGRFGSAVVSMCSARQAVRASILASKEATLSAVSAWRLSAQLSLLLFEQHQ